MADIKNTKESLIKGSASETESDGLADDYEA